MRKPKQITYVVWLDSHATSEPGIWHDEEKISVKGKPVITVGFVLKENKKFLALVSSRSQHEVSGDITIPKIAILERKTFDIG